MAKVDSIVQQIRNAQAAAIAKNGGITANNGAAVEADTKAILQQQIAARQSANKSSGDEYTPSGQAAKPAQQQVTDTRTTQQKYEDAQKALSDYTASDEYRIKQQERNREALRQAQERIFAAGASASDLPLNLVSATPEADTREQELKATVEHYKAQMDAEANQAVQDADLAEYETWSEEDRANLDRYIMERDQKFYNSLNPAMSDAFITAKDLEVNPVVEKYGQKRVNEMAETLTRQRNQQITEQMTEAAKESAGKGFWSGAGHSLLSVPANVLGGITGLVGLGKEGQQRTGRYATLDANNEGNLLNAYAGAVRGEVAENIAGDEYSETGEQTKEGGTGRQLLSYGYQGIMSLADSISRSLAFGPAGGAALAASSSFTQTVSDASRRGATPQQAVALGVATAGMEYISEKIPMDEVFKLAKGGKTNVLVQAFKQAGIEITTEELSLFGSMAAEAAILQEKSSYKQQIGDLVANGASYEDAKEQANKAIWEEVKQTAWVSGISGGVSGAGASIVGNLNAPQTAPTEIPQETAEAAPVTEIAQPEPTSFLDDAAQQLAQEAPAAAPVELTPEQQMVEQAAAETMGVQPETQPIVDTAPQTEYDNNIIVVPGATVGRSDVTYTADNKPVQFQYAVVPAESLVTSNDQYGNVNKAYPAELQPRDRTRAASQTQINSMSRNLNPALLAESPTAQNGAPIIRGDGVVIGGNGRVSAIAQAYGAGRGAEYQQYITQRAAELGIDPATLPANPVLVRVTNGVDNYTELANSLNASTTATYSATEAAKADATRVGDIVDYLSVSEDGNINTADNRDFIQKFVSQVVPETERGDVMQANGQLSQAGERRIQNALFAYAYGDTALIERLTERTDSNIKNITGAMLKVSGRIASLQNAIDSGEVQNLGVREAVTSAVNLYLDAKNSQQTVTDAASQLVMGENGVESQYDGLTVHIAKALETYSRSGKQMQMFFTHLIDNNLLAAAEDAGQTGMFDTGGNITQEELYDQTVQSFGEAGGRADQLQPKSDFSQYREYQPEAVLEGMGGTGTEGVSGTQEVDGGHDGSVSQGLPGGQPGVSATTESVGAASQNFTEKPAYNATLSEDNAQADRRDDVRPMELPQRDINGGNVSAVTGNVYGSKITPDDFASLMEEPTAKGDFSYAKITNDQATQRATETIASAGTWENAYDSWKQSVTSGNAGAEMSARGALFLNHAAQQGNKQLWLETLHYMQKLGTNTAQGLQAFRIIRTLKPVDKIEFVKMSVEKMATEVKEKHGIDLEIDQTLIDEFEQAETDEDRDAVLEDIQQNVADQIPSTFLDKWTALRYMNMLGNLRTNVRNVAGNIGSAAVYRIKDTIATGMEAIASKVSGGESERTKSLFVRKSLLDACKEDFRQFKETVSSGGKYGERMSATSQFAQGVQDKRRIFKNSALEAYRKGTNWMMNNEYFGDEAFGRAAYSRALAGYLQANGVTGSDLSEVDGTLLDKARAYAVKEAQEATFHDNSALAQTVSKVQKDTGVVGQGIMPFTKTPANVLTRAEEFSPLGLINSTVKSIQKARGNEDISGADVINSWAKSITGVGLFALGAAMMDQGLLTGGPDEDEEKAAFDELNGQQNYAIQLPNGTNYTIDWLTPAAMPMFMGAQFWKMLSSDQDLTFADMEQVFTSIADPLIQMSMLQGLNDSLDGIKYSDNNLGQFFINAAVSYLTQGLTNTLMGQLERSTEENRQTTYIDKNSNTPEWLQRQLGKASQKIPGWDYQQMDYRNAWGQTEKNEGGLLYNLLSPGYVSKEQSNRITQELYRLRETTGENVFPQAVEKTITYTDVTGTKHINRALTQTELDTIQRVEGQTAMRLLAEITANEDYNSLTDAQRAAVISNVYKYAQEQGKKEALTGYYSEAAAWLQNMGDDAANGLIQRAALSTINSSVTKIVDNIENEWAVSPAAQQELDGLFDAYNGMSKEAQRQILDEAVSDTAKYLEIRSKGLDTTQYLDVVGDIKALEVEPNFSDIRDIQIREAIAKNGSLSTREKDIVMRAYMPDYDPTAKSPQKTELKYDAIRELGVSPQGYTDAYRDYLDASGTGKRRRTIAHYMKTYGWDRSTAQKVYDIYAGYYKPWE